MNWKLKYVLFLIIFYLVIITSTISCIYITEKRMAEKRIAEQKNEITEIKPEKIKSMQPVSSELIKLNIEETIKIAQENEVVIEEPKTISLGEFKLTAYCSCEKCCDEYAKDRPVDKYGNEIVYGSIGEELIEGISIAVDPNVIPYWTEVIINGNTYIAHDTGGAIDGNRIDVYHNDHQKAREFGVQYAEVFKVIE